MKKFFIPIACMLMISHNSSGQTKDPASLTDELKQVPQKEKQKFAVDGGPVVPAPLWSADASYNFEGIFYLGLTILGTYSGYVPDGSLPSEIWTANVTVGLGIPKNLKKPWDKLQGSGMAGFFGPGIVERSYGNVPYQCGFFMKARYTFLSARTFSMNMYFMPLYSSLAISENQNGLTYGYNQYSGWQMNFGGGVMF